MTNSIKQSRYPRLSLCPLSYSKLRKRILMRFLLPFREFLSKGSYIQNILLIFINRENSIFCNEVVKLIHGNHLQDYY